MSRISTLSIMSAAASAIALSASLANAAVLVPVNVPRPTISVPRPTISMPTLKVTPAVSAKTVTVQGAAATTITVNGQTLTRTTEANGTQVFTNQQGRIVMELPPAVTASSAKPTAAPQPSAPKPSPAPQPSAPKPVSAPASSQPVTFTPKLYPALTNQTGSTVGYYVNGNYVSGLKGPTGGTCVTVMAYQSAGGGLSSNFSSGATLVPAVQCYIKT